jgi:hypothetical protein
MEALDYKKKQIYEYYEHNVAYPVTKEIYEDVLYSVIEKVKDRIVNGHSVLLPADMGKVQVKRYRPTSRINKYGEVYDARPLNIHETIKLRKELAERGFEYEGIKIDANTPSDEWKKIPANVRPAIRRDLDKTQGYFYYLKWTRPIKYLLFYRFYIMRFSANLTKRIRNITEDPYSTVGYQISNLIYNRYAKRKVRKFEVRDGTNN